MRTRRKPLTRRTRRWLFTFVAIVLVTLFLWQNGLHNIGSLDAQASDGCNAQKASTRPHLPTVPKLSAGERVNPSQLKGQTTAYTRSSTIVPIADYATARQRLPVTVQSDDGAKQTVKDTSRILALNQSGGLASAVIGLGLGCNLVGRDVATKVGQLMPGSSELPLVTQNGHELNAEAILNLSPTVVITDTSIGPYDVQKQLRSAGIPVVFIPNSTEKGIDGVGAQIAQVGEALGVRELGQQLAKRTLQEISQTIKNLHALAPKKAADRPRTVFLYLRGAIYYWFGEGSGADSLIQAIGARDVAKEVGFKGMSPTNSEALVKAAPDTIIVMTKGLASVGGIDEALKLPGIKQTPAGKNRRIVDMSDYEVMSFGPRTANVLAALGTAVFAPSHAYVPKEIPTL